jgi:hypothetical protein
MISLRVASARVLGWRPTLFIGGGRGFEIDTNGRLKTIKFDIAVTSHMRGTGNDRRYPPIAPELSQVYTGRWPLSRRSGALVL